MLFQMLNLILEKKTTGSNVKNHLVNMEFLCFINYNAAAKYFDDPKPYRFGFDLKRRLDSVSNG